MDEDWAEHTGLTYDEKWQASFERMRSWPTLAGDLAERYVDNHVEMIGSGGYSFVFKARRDDRMVALKVFKPVAEGFRIQDWVKTILQELRALAYVHDIGCQRNVACFVDNFKARLGGEVKRAVADYFAPEIVNQAQRNAFIESHFSYVNSPAPAFCIETELVQGLNMLDAMLLGQRATSFTPEKNLRLLVTAARGLKFLHDSGLAHGDIKPANLALLNLDAAHEDATEVVILDLGSACRVDPSLQNLDFPPPAGVCSQFMTGSREYMAPTLFRYATAASGDPTVPLARTIPFSLRAKFDVYALALSFFDWSEGDAVAQIPAGGGEAREPTEPYFNQKRVRGELRGDTKDRDIAKALGAMLVADDDARPTITQVLEWLDE